MKPKAIYWAGKMMVESSANGLWLPTDVVDEMMACDEACDEDACTCLDCTSEPEITMEGSSLSALLKACMGMRKVIAEMYEVDEAEKVLPNWITEGRRRVAELSCLGFRCFDRSVRALAVHNRMRIR